eukprot:TRINITY_DN1425_c0_g2_i1.p1 TRINITY_DN1425_c0_g2~~TRINITY_DN1425_c0_g2_i1.p1  ORF type:complete len:765 (-),score=180.82 TRINITY_DN1425_c0_g2_i1:591-2885(-)
MSSNAFDMSQIIAALSAKDIDASGAVSASDFQAALKDAGVKFGTIEGDAVMASIKITASGRVDVSAITQQSNGPTNSPAPDMFRNRDQFQKTVVVDLRDQIHGYYIKYEDGELSAAQFLGQLKQLGIDTATVEKLIKRREEGSSKVRYSDILKAMFHENAGAKAPETAGVDGRVDSAELTQKSKGLYRRDHDIMNWEGEGQFLKFGSNSGRTSGIIKRADSIKFDYSDSTDPLPAESATRPRPSLGKPQVNPVSWQGEEPPSPVKQPNTPQRKDRDLIGWTNENEESDPSKVKSRPDVNALRDHDVICGWSAEELPVRPRSAAKQEELRNDPVTWKDSKSSTIRSSVQQVQGKRSDSDVINWDKQAERAEVSASKEAALEVVRSLTCGDITSAVFLQQLRAIPDVTVSVDLEKLMRKFEQGARVTFREIVQTLFTEQKPVEIETPTGKSYKEIQNGDIVGWTGDESNAQQASSQKRMAPVQSSDFKIGAEELEPVASVHKPLPKALVPSMENEEVDSKHAEIKKLNIQQKSSGILDPTWSKSVPEEDHEKAVQKFKTRLAENSKHGDIFNSTPTEQDMPRKELPKSSQMLSTGNTIGWEGYAQPEESESPKKAPKEHTPTAHEVEVRKLTEQQYLLSKGMNNLARYRDRYADSPIGWRSAIPQGADGSVEVVDESSAKSTSNPKNVTADDILSATSLPSNRTVKIMSHQKSSVFNSEPEETASSSSRSNRHNPNATVESNFMAWKKSSDQNESTMSKEARKDSK